MRIWGDFNRRVEIYGLLTKLLDECGFGVFFTGVLAGVLFK